MSSKHGDAYAILAAILYKVYSRVWCLIDVLLMCGCRGVVFTPVALVAHLESDESGTRDAHALYVVPCKRSWDANAIRRNRARDFALLGRCSCLSVLYGRSSGEQDVSRDYFVALMTRQRLHI